MKESGADAATLDAAKTSVEEEEAVVNKLLAPLTWDDKYWAIFVTLITIAVLYRGQYNLIQTISTGLVVTFTFVTIGNVISLQLKPEFQLSASEIISGLWFQLPETLPAPPGIVGWEIKRPLATALFTFGIIGVGASELVMYPYWCLEKGYAKFTGVRSDDEGWANRARGWMKVMRYDAFLSMVIYTGATVAFFLLGAALLQLGATISPIGPAGAVKGMLPGVAGSGRSGLRSACLAMVLRPFFSLADQLELVLLNTARVKRLRVLVANSTS